MSTTLETIIPLVKICRKLRSNNTSKLSAWLQDTPKLFEKHNAQTVFIQILIKGICDNHHIIPSKLFDEMIYLLPTEKELSINDTITMSDINSDASKILDTDNNFNANGTESARAAKQFNFLTTTKDLKIAVFNFLTENDLFQVQQTCRCLCIAARDTYSLYHLRIESNFNSNKYMKHWYSNIKSLSCSLLDCRKVNPKWYKNVISLSVDSIHNVQRSGYFMSVQQCKLSNAVPLFIQNKINCATLKCLELFDFEFSHELVPPLLKCINLEKLSFLGNCSSARHNLEIFNNYKFICPKCPLKNLKYFKIRQDSLLKLSYFVVWILSNNHCNKTLEITPSASNIEIEHYIACGLFYKCSQIGLLSLNNINSIKYSGFCGQTTNVFLTNVSDSIQTINKTKFGEQCKRFNCLDLDLTSYKQRPFSTELLNSINSIVPFCHSSKVKLEFMIGTYPQYGESKQWALNVINSFNSFDTLLISVLMDGDMDDLVDVEIDDFLDLDEERTIKLREKATEFATNLIEYINEWFKPWLKMTQDKMRKTGMKLFEVEFVCEIQNYFEFTAFDKEDLEEGLCSLEGVFYPTIEDLVKQTVGTNCTVELADDCVNISSKIVL